MSFLSGLFLFALPLAAVPIALHFYRRRQKDVVAWGAMQFLVDAAKEGQQRERLEEILLMLLRCAAVLALVLALARPQIHSQWLGESPQREVILVIDNSLSMSRRIDDTSAFSHVRTNVQEILGNLSRTDLVQVVLAAGGPDWLTSAGLPADEEGKSQLSQKIEELQPSQGTADLFAAIQAAVDAGAAPEIRARHVIVLTDLQAHGWQPNALQHWRDFKVSTDSRRFPVSVQVLPCGPAAEFVDNLTVVRMETSATQCGPGQPVHVDCEVTNSGDISSHPVVLEQLVDGQVTGTSEIPALAAGESKSVSWTWHPDQTGVQALGCQINVDDQLLMDNSRTVIVEVVERIPVLVVESASEYREQMSGAELLTAALGYHRETAQANWRSVFAPTVIPAAEMHRHALADYKAVVITCVTPLLSDSADRLRNYVEQGGGLWLVPGRRTDRDTFNAVWYDDGGGLSPLPLSGLITSTSASESPDDELTEEQIHPPGSDHPATAQISDTTRLDIDSVRIASRLSFDQRAAQETLSVLLETGGGDPLVVEQYVGRGRVIVQALPFGLGWSNLPLTQAWVVLVSDWLEYLTQPAATQFNLAPGSRIELAQSAAGGQREATIVTPDGWKRSLTLHDASESARYRFSQTQYPGRYEIRFGTAEESSHLVPFEVTRDAQESDLTPLTADQQRLLTESSGIDFKEVADTTLHAVPVAGSQRPIWNSLLTGLLILLAIELLLATITALRRSPQSSLPESSLPGLDESTTGSFPGPSTSL